VAPAAATVARPRVAKAVAATLAANVVVVPVTAEHMTEGEDRNKR
jgi:hypothetical protein